VDGSLIFYEDFPLLRYFCIHCKECIVYEGDKKNKKPVNWLIVSDISLVENCLTLFKTKFSDRNVVPGSTKYVDQPPS